MHDLCEGVTFVRVVEVTFVRVLKVAYTRVCPGRGLRG